jgi:hypothetical protein
VFSWRIAVSSKAAFAAIYQEGAKIRNDHEPLKKNVRALRAFVSSCLRDNQALQISCFADVKNAVSPIAAPA